MRSRGRLAVLAAVGASAGGLTTVAFAAEPAAQRTPGRASAVVPSSSPYGLVAFNSVFVPGSSVAERTANYRKLYAAGVRAIRVGFDWFYVEPPGPPKHDYAFTGVDREVKAITDAGLKVIGLLGYGHPDYSSRGGTVNGTPLRGGLPPFYVANAGYFPPDNPADFARYASDTARHLTSRYPGKIVGWEIWNEQNEGWRFWPPREDPPAYARLLCAAYGSLKQVDARLPVLYGGVFFPALADLPGTSGPKFLEQTYAANPHLGACFDAVAYHPYPYPFTAPELDVPVRGSVLAAADAMKAVLTRHGDGTKPLWITEVGWPTHDRAYGVSEEKQGEYVARMQAATFAQRLPVLTWYTYGDYADPTGINQEAWFGFFRPDGSPKPSYAALKTFAKVFAGARFKADRSRALGLPPGQQNTGGRGFALEYARRTARITALWYANESVAEGQNQLPDGGTATGRTIAVRLPASSRSVTVVDYLGSSRTVAVRDGRVTLTLGPGPLYVIDRLPSSRGRRPRGPALQIALHLSCPRRELVAELTGPGRTQVTRARFAVDGRSLSGRGRTRRVPSSYLDGRRHRLDVRATLRSGAVRRVQRTFRACGRRS